jgi:hypothetical protein
MCWNPSLFKFKGFYIEKMRVCSKLAMAARINVDGRDCSSELEREPDNRKANMSDMM